MEKIHLNCEFGAIGELPRNTMLYDADKAKPIVATLAESVHLRMIVDPSLFTVAEPTTSVTLAVQQVGRSLRSPEWHKRQRMYNLRRRVAILLGAAGGFAMGAALFYAATT